MKVAIAVLVSLGSSSSALAEPSPDPYAAIVLAATGRSFSLGERRVANQAPPGAEIRLAYRPWCARWSVPDLTLGVIVFPEVVPTLGVGYRVHPFMSTPAARHLFARVGAVGLVSIEGFDLAVTGEVGAAVTKHRLIGWLGLGADRYLLHPRVAVQVRLGVGLTF